MAEPGPGAGYDKSAYDHEQAPIEYEQRSYYQGLLGRYRKMREKQAVFQAVQQFERGSTVLDCPCGNGRWFDRLAMRAKSIIGRDVAKSMADAAAKRRVVGTELDVTVGDAEALALDDDAVDHVFSYALMKHLPADTQHRVMKEFARVSTGRIVVSFGVLSPVSVVLWKLRGAPEYPIWPADVEALARAAGLRIGATYKVGVPMAGMETLVVFERSGIDELG